MKQCYKLKRKYLVKNTVNLFLISAITFFLSACAGVDYSQKAVFPEAKADQALIYFYRTPGFIGSTYRFNVSEGDKVVGAMAQDSYFYLFTEAGEHTYSTNDQYQEKGNFITMNVKAGEVYYVRVDYDYQVLGGKPVYTLVDKAEAMTLLKTRKYVVPTKKSSSTYNVHAEQ
ncbi:MAG: DUF2846 domain-containing protein [Gammaproteobacteria bacterium]|nr:DUF2846 domain-containing protein [Gammaproteobacteria bacterium]